MIRNDKERDRPHDTCVRPYASIGAEGWHKFCFQCGAEVVGPTEESVIKHWKKVLGGTGCPPPQFVLSAIADGGRTT